MTFVCDAIGAENLPAYQASIWVNFPLTGDAVLDTEDLLSVLGPDRLSAGRDDAYAADQLKSAFVPVTGWVRTAGWRASGKAPSPELLSLDP